MANVPVVRRRRWYLSVWKHPLTLLVLGSALSSILIPWISEQSSHRRILQEQRVEQARDILKQSVTDDQQLNTMLTSFEMFDKEAKAAPKTVKPEQVELAHNFTKLYLDFDQRAWWWGHDLPMQAKLLEVPVQTKTIDELKDAYAKNLVDSSQQIERLRRQFLGSAYKPQDSRNAEALAAVRTKMLELGVVRGAIASRLAGLFMPPGVKW